MAQTTTLNVANPFSSSYDIVITLINQDPDPGEPGQYVDVRFRVENQGTEPGKNVSIELLPAFPFSVVGSARKDIGTLEAQQKGSEGVVVKYRLRVDGAALEGENQLELRYQVMEGGWAKLSPFNITIKAQDAILAVMEVETDPDQVHPGEKVNVTLTLRNLAARTLKNVQVKLELDNVPFAPFHTTNEKTIVRLGSQEEKSATFTLVTDPDAASQIHKILYKLSYQDEQQVSYARNGTFGMMVYDKPQFLVNLEDSEVYEQLDNGNIVISLSNTGTSTLKFVTLELKESAAYQVLSAKKVYLGNLESDDYETAEFMIHPTNEESQSIPLNLLVEYKDNYNQAYNKMEVVELPIYSQEDAVRYGLKETANTSLSYFGYAFGILILVFMIFMVINALTNPSLPWYKKILWVIVILIPGIGALLYFFIARKTEQ